MTIGKGLSLFVYFSIIVFLVSCASDSLLEKSPSSTEVSPVAVMKSTEEPVKIIRTVKGFMMWTDPYKNILPIKEGLVVLQDDNYTELGRGKTDENGYFEFSLELDKGSYSLIYNNGDYHKIFEVNDEEVRDLGYLNINPTFD